MRPCVLVGVDSGGTRTNVGIVVSDGQGATTESHYEVVDSLSGVLAPDLISTVLYRIFAPLEMHFESLQVDSLPCFGWISAAGFSPWTRDDYMGGIADMLPKVAGTRFETVGAGNDAVSLLLGLRSDGVVIAGTGSNVVVRSSDGSVHQVGGRDWVASDYGSGFWIGLNSLRRAYSDFEAGVDSVVLQRVRQIYGIRPDDERSFIAKMRDLAIGDENMKKEIARVTSSICAAAERGDQTSQNIVKGGAEDLADVMAVALRRHFEPDALRSGIDLIQCGSLLGNSFYRSSFEQQLDMRLLTGGEKTQITWQRVATGLEASLELAKDLSNGRADLLKLDVAFRPVVVAP